jgi:hypothetical protein
VSSRDSIADLKLFERLLEEEEDRIDVEAARVALAESDERISYEEFCRRQRISDGANPKQPRSKSGARSKTL